MARRRARRVTVAAVVLCLLAGPALASCADQAADSVDYAVDGALVSYNTNTVAGAASGGPQAFARALTGFTYHGPEGQIVGDHDFGSTNLVGRNPLVLDYEIKPEAVYSDGKPVTCDDMVLAWAAQSGRFPAFDAASRAGYTDIATVECVPGQKKARVSFAQDRPFTDYGQLFTATSLMPAHVLADELGLGDGGVTRALLDNDGPVVERIAAAWNTVWDLTPDVDLARFPSSGPYKLDSVSADGSVVLVANDKWWGTMPITGRVVVHPRSSDMQDRVDEGAYDVVDIASGSLGTLNLPDDYQRSESASAGVEQLLFAPQGPLAAVPARRAVALCTPRDVIARNAEVPVVNSRLNTATEDAYGAAETTPEAGEFAVANPDAARAALGGQPLTVRMGYQTPNARLAALVGAIARSCAPAGITVEDVAGADTGPLALRNNEIDVLVAGTGGAAGSGSSGSSAVDAYTLHSANGNNLPRYANERIDGIISTIAVINDPKEIARLLAEAAPILWGDMPTLPLYRQQRTLVTSTNMFAVSANPTRWGAGWNMDRWKLSQ
ncbi:MULTISPECIES: ABC transporter substrate-binding protein [Mycobacteriaceae]|uniref:ABC transporter substrate-binding protein n=1 Tax=Mycolicibacterium parafortuitum TaxID=39692 RepID=A0ACC6ML44_MYCPF|nr:MULTISPECIES: ABC transporter substrate-binding protein [Mycobacteriaceae]MDZ5087321.1 ABC transporter substrate-binding protein [Mycolicibacterium parafortuitum]GFM18149.1 extracellular solute-binding protein [Mycobacterium sp. PO1]GFM26626.1 extracellular solute-binding protein [Mycobacterium sp. PO2]